MMDKELRERAEKRVGAFEADATNLSAEQLKRVVHELQVHQAELEMQNDELSRTQQQLQVANERATHLYDFAPVGYVTIDKKGAIIEANLTVAKLFQTPRNELIGTWLSQSFPACDADVLYLHYQATRKGSGAHSCELTLEIKGTTRYVRLDSVLAETDNPEGDLRTAFTDLTDQRRAEMQSLAANDQLLEGQRLSAIGTLTSGVAHDFGNLLVPILTHAELLAMTFAAGSAQKEHVDRILAATHAAADLCTQMRQYVGSGETEKTPLSLSALLRSDAALLDSMTSESVQVSFHSDDSTPSINGDSTQLRRLLMNLVTNASEAIGKHEGVIAISAKSVRLSGDEIDTLILDEDALLAGDYVMVEVSDDGCGMDAQTLKRVFDPFFSTKVSGRGLGMAATFGIIRSHGAGVKIDSRLGRGTSVKIYFPATDCFNHPLNSNVVQPDVIEGEGTILVVDDNAAVAQSTAAMLTAIGYSVLIAGSGGEAIAVCREQRKLIDLIFIDYSMPEMDGITALKEIHSFAPELLAILTSGGLQPEVLSNLKSFGIHDFLPKPHRSDDLSRLVSEAVLERRKHRSERTRQ